MTEWPKTPWLVGFLLALMLFVSSSSMRARQGVGQDELHYLEAGDTLYKEGFSRGPEIIALSPHLLPQLINGAYRLFGQSVPVARLLPVQDDERADIRTVIASLRAFRDEHPLNSESIRELIDEERRY